MEVSTVDQNHESLTRQGSNRESNNFEIRKISGDATVRWLSKGIEDFKKTNLNSLLYSLVFVITGAITIWFTRYNPVYVMAIITGFYLVGPLVATGLYDMSNKIEKDETPSFIHALSVLGQNTQCLLGLTLILGGLLVVWTGVSSVLVSSFFGEGSGTTTLLSGSNPIPFSGVLLIGGIILALIASAVSLTFLPLLNNRHIGTLTMLAILGLIMLAWVRITVLAINSFVDNSEMISSGWNALLNDPQFLTFLIVFLLAGLVFAAIAFTISVIAVPMIIDRRVNLMVAISTSIKAVRENPMAMFRWAATIAVAIAVGLSLFFVGLIIAFPVIGHASWHAYRELVVDSNV